MTTEFRLNDQTFVALNGGPHYQFSPATSFVINCDTQDEVDHYWEKLSEDGEPNQCGWTTDKFGVTWQIVPRRFMELIGDKNPKKVQAVMAAMMTMVKLDVAALEKAYATA
jgi:predicted 3-demethylubiquinone-9 3-methyltransferase (glyoxalase superfamily)